MSRKRKPGLYTKRPTGKSPKKFGPVDRRIAPFLVILVFAIAAGTVFMVKRNPRTTATASRSTIEVPTLDTSTMEPRVARLINEARQAVLGNLHSADAWGRLGQACDAHELYDCAAPCYQRAMQLEGGDDRWPYNLGVVRQFQNADLDEVMELFEIVAQRSPKFPPTFCRMGDVLSRQGRLTEARDAYRRAAGLAPNLAAAHRAAGQTMLALGEIDSAIVHLKRAVQLVNNDGPAHAALSQAYARKGDLKGAKEAAEKSKWFRSVIALPDPIRFAVTSQAISSEQCRERAERHFANGEYDQAAAQYEIVLQARPKDVSAHRALGTTLMRMGRIEEAERHLQKANVDPGTLHLAKGRVDDAIRLFRTALDRRPDRGKIRAKMATALAMKGRLDEALVEFQRASVDVKLDSQSELNWGNTLMELNRFDEAEEHFRLALRAWPNYSFAHYKLGLILERRGDLEQALEHYRVALQLDPSDRTRQRLAALESRLP